MAVIVPQLTYECSVWYFLLGEKKQQKDHLAALDSVQTTAIQIITTEYKTICSQVVDVKAGILPLKLYIKILMGKSLLRLATSI